MRKKLVGLALLMTLLSCASSRRESTGVAMLRQPEPEPTATGTVQAPRIEIDAPAGPAPWTHLSVLDSEDSFQFAIVSDNTGGAREGVFASAIAKLNLLEPEFVMSVGDLIEGYTKDRAELIRQWEAFDEMVEPLAAPFFYVPGNHDITNDVMRQIWHERYGPSRYWFRYKGVLFVCLDSMDGATHHIGDRQIGWLSKTLAENADVSWTLVFLHSPLWDDGPGVTLKSEDVANWERVEGALGDRPFTVFAGHHHRYVKHVRNDRKHFTLATTGGVSSLRGPRYGEFDHVTWVTMTPQGPVLANLELNGILNEDVRTQASREFSFSLTDGAALKSAPLYFEDSFTSGASVLRLRNPFDVPVDLQLSLSVPNGFDVEFAERRVRVQPNDTIDLPLTVSARPPFTGDYARIRVGFHAAVTTDGGPLEYEGETAVAVVRSLNSKRAEPAIVVDGSLADWGRLAYGVRHPRQIRRNADAYRGPSDNRFEVGVRHDDAFVYVAVRVFDDHVEARKTLAPWKQDGVEIRFDARQDPIRSHYAGARDGRDVVLVALSPSDRAEETWLYHAGWIQPPEGIVARCRKTRGGFVAEVAVPREALRRMGSSDAVRINVAVDDGDADGQSQSWWWPDWRESAHVPGTGTFRL